MTTWKPSPRPGVYVISLALGLLLVVEAYVLSTVLGREFDLGSFLLALLALLDLALVAGIGYLLYGLVRLDYAIDSRALTITWGAVRHVLPLEAITDVFTTFPWQQIPLNTGINLPGYYMGRGTDDGGREVVFLATSRSPGQLAFVATKEVTYAISPRDRDTFINTLNRCRTRPTGAGTAPSVLAPWLFRIPYWQDRLAHALLLVGLASNLAVFAYVSFKFPGLPPVLPLHYNIVGEIDFLGTRVESFKIPSIGTAVLLANFAAGIVLHSRERAAAILLLATAVVVQAVLLVATVKILV